MNVKDVLTNDFTVRYAPDEKALLIYPGDAKVPIRLRLSMLEEMGPVQATQFVGERLLLLVPELRAKVMGVKDPEA